VSGGLAQIQQRLMDALDKINNLPINPLLEQATSTLAQSEKRCSTYRRRWIV
jgi:paraquat-inducible protein B